MGAPLTLPAVVLGLGPAHFSARLGLKGAPDQFRPDGTVLDNGYRCPHGLRGPEHEERDQLPFLRLTGGRQAQLRGVPALVVWVGVLNYEGFGPAVVRFLGFGFPSADESP